MLTGGVDANMSPTSYIKFAKIGALSASGSRPYDDRADGDLAAFFSPSEAGSGRLREAAEIERVSYNFV